MTRPPRITKTKITFATLVTALLGSLSPFSYAEDPKPAAKERITYDDHVAPILRRKCFGCHNPDKKKGGLALNTYTLAMAGGSSGNVIKPGDADASRLLLLVTHQEEPHMPPRGGMLPDASLGMIRKWIEIGAPENKGSKVRLPDKPRIDLSVATTPGVRPDGPPPMPRGVSLEPVVRTTRTTAITALATNPWSPLIAISGQKQILLYDVERTELAGILPFPEGIAHVLKFSRNGALLLAGGGRGADSGRVVVWDVRTGDRVIELGEEFDQILAADISADHSLIAISGPSKLLRIYSTEDGELLHEIKKHTDWIYTLEFSPDGVLLASGDRNGGLHIWESFSGREYLTLRGHGAGVTDVSWRADSNILASVSEDSTVRLWEMENGGQVKRWNAHGGGTLSVDFARDGKIVTCGRDRHATLWNGDGGRIRNFEQFADLALEVTFDHSGSRVVAGDWSGEVRVWNAADGKRITSLSTNPITLATRLEAARKELAARAAEHEQISREIAALKDNAKKAVGELDKAKVTVASALQKKSAAAENVNTNRSTADAIATTLKEALKSLTAREQDLEKAADAPTPDANAIKTTTIALDAARDATRKMTEELTKTLQAREVARKALDETRAGVRAVSDVVGKKTADVKAANDQLAARTGAFDEQAARRAKTAAAVDKWLAAIEIDKTLHTIARLSSALSTATATLEAAKTARGAAATRLVALAKTLEDAGASAQEASDATSSAAKILLEKSRVSSAQAAKAIAAISRISVEKEPADAKSDLLQQQLTSIQKASKELIAAVRDATKIWEEAKKTAGSAAARAESTVGEFEKQLAVVRAASSEVVKAAKTVESTKGALDAARRARTEWTGKFETAGKLISGSSEGLAAKKS
jgi:hypothetical protein